MILFDYITHTKSNRFERLKMAAIVASATLSANNGIKFFGNTIDDIGSIETDIRLNAERQKKTNTGHFMNNFQIEKGKDFIKVWHINIDLVRDELISEVYIKKEVEDEK